MSTLQIRLSVPSDKQDLVVAELLDLSVEGFENQTDSLWVYLRPADWHESARSHLELILSRHGLDTTWKEEVIEDKNWNRIWEASIDPIVVHPFLIRPSWYKSEDHSTDLIELIVDPKMSFGTGHHETTRLMLQHMVAHGDRLDRVLDAGTGTGILAIAAARLGARSVLAYDNDPWCLENATENVRVNNVADIVRVRLGSLSVVSESGFSVILANINRNVLLGDLSGFRERLNEGGVLLLSGLLLQDRDMMVQALESVGLTVLNERSEGDWWSVSAS